MRLAPSLKEYICSLGVILDPTLILHVQTAAMARGAFAQPLFVLELHPFMLQTWTWLFMLWSSFIGLMCCTICETATGDPWEASMDTECSHERSNRNEILWPHFVSIFLSLLVLSLPPGTIQGAV